MDRALGDDNILSSRRGQEGTASQVGGSQENTEKKLSRAGNTAMVNTHDGSSQVSEES